MIGIVVTGHGLFAEGIQSSATMIAGANAHARYVCFKEGMSTEDLAADLNTAFAEMSDCDGIVVLSDLPGGSPFRTAAECAFANPQQKIVVLSGINLPMVITALSMIEFEEDVDALANELVFEGKESVVRFELSVPAEAPAEEDEDGI
jgi:PTS system N-acetylgalactosamine-specific IIA component